MFDRSLVDVMDMLHALGVSNVKRIGDEVQFSCPMPAHSFGDVHPSASMNVDSTVWYCFSCGAKGDAVSFLAAHEGVSVMLAARWLRERYDPGETGGSASERLHRALESRVRDRKEPLVPQPEIVDAKTLIRPDWEAVAGFISQVENRQAMLYLFQRGFTAETLNKFGWAYDRASKRLSFDVRDEDGRLIGLKARAWWDDEPLKYIALGDTPRSTAANGEVYGFAPYMSAHTLYAVDKVRTATEVVVREGELNAMMLHQMGVPAVGLPGSSLSKVQQIMVRRNFERVVLWFDWDDAGRAGMLDAAEALRAYMPVSCVGPHEGDPCSLTPDECMRLIDRATPAISLLR